MKKLWFAIILTIFLSTTINAMQEIEDDYFKIRCDKDGYNVILGTSYAYCNVTSKMNTSSEIKLEWVFEQSNGIVFGDTYRYEWTNISYFNVTLNATDTYEGYDWVLMPEAVSTINKKGFSGFELDKPDMAPYENMQLRLSIEVTNISATDEFWVNIESGDIKLELDPAVAGCNDADPNTLKCVGNTFTGNTLVSTKNILIANATIDGSGVTANVTINSTLGYVHIYNSSIDANDSTKGTNSYTAENIFIYVFADDYIIINDSNLWLDSGLVLSNFAGFNYIRIKSKTNNTRIIDSAIYSKGMDHNQEPGMGSTFYIGTPNASCSTCVTDIRQTSVHSEAGDTGNVFDDGNEGWIYGYRLRNVSNSSFYAYGKNKGDSTGRGGSGVFIVENYGDTAYTQDTGWIEAYGGNGVSFPGGDATIEIKNATTINIYNLSKFRAYSNDAENKSRIKLYAQTEINLHNIAGIDSNSNNIDNATRYIRFESASTNRLSVLNTVNFDENIWVQCPYTSLVVGNDSVIDKQINFTNCASYSFTSYSEYVDSTAPTYTSLLSNGTNYTRRLEEFNCSFIPNDNSVGGYYIFSFYNGTKWLNNTPVSWAGSEGTRVTVKENSTYKWYNNSCMFWFNDSQGYVNYTSILGFNVSNTIPFVENVSITPSPAQTANDLTCRYNWSDADGDSVAFTNYYWYKNGALQAPNTVYNNSLLNYTNTSTDEQWACKVTVNDGYNTSTIDGSANLTIGDTLTPSVLSTSLSAASIYLTNSITFYSNVTDVGSDIDFVYFEVESPTDKDNKTASLAEGTNSPGQTTQWSYPYTPTALGTYYLRIFVQDGSGNLNYTETRNLTFTVSTAPSSPTGGGGGGSKEVEVNITEELRGIVLCGNGVCDVGETYVDCPEDCQLLDVLFFDCLINLFVEGKLGETCAWKEAWFLNIAFVAIILIIIISRYNATNKGKSNIFQKKVKRYLGRIKNGKL